MLSKRLNEVANLIEHNKVVYDVGSDHGLLPCFLVLNNISPKAYASDNKKGPYNKAVLNIKKYNLEDKVIPILGDGIDKISNDVDIITICGMGFYTVKHILDNKNLSKYEKVIVQVNKDVSKLRKWISDNHYKIIDERIVKDDFYYEIVVFNATKGPVLSSLECEYGPINLANRDSIFISYLRSRKLKLAKIDKISGKNIYKNKAKELNDIIRG